MSGHSKWATIKRQKGVADAKKGQLFTKFASAIAIAVKQGGGPDVASNYKLRLIVDKAKASNMPKDSIERAIQKGAGANGGAALEEVVYEGFGPTGVVFIIEAVTDKKQRTVAEVKNVLEKNGGSMGAQGSVAYMFDKVGEIVVKKTKSFDEALDIAIGAGATDVEDDGDLLYIYTDSQKLSSVKDAIESGGLEIEDAEIIYKPKSLTQNPDVQEKVEMLMQKIDDLEDVQKVYTNFDFSL